ncbi:MAG: hypothetical protein WCS43_13810, partial [Verrucomicrobiota bacterium]
ASETVARNPHCGPAINEYKPNKPTNHSGCQPASKHQNAAANATAEINDDHANKRFADTRWSANAPPINGEIIAHTGGTTNTAVTQSPKPLETRILVSAGNQNPGDMPCRKNTTQSRVKTTLGSSSRFS